MGEASCPTRISSLQLALGRDSRRQTASSSPSPCCSSSCPRPLSPSRPLKASPSCVGRHLPRFLRDPVGCECLWSPCFSCLPSCSVLSVRLQSLDLRGGTPSAPLDQMKIAASLSLLYLFYPFSVCLLLGLFPPPSPSLLPPPHCVNAAMLTLDQCAVELGLAKEEKSSTLPFQPPPFIPLPVASPITPTHPSCGCRADSCAPLWRKPRAHLARTPKHQVLMKQLEV